MTSRWMTAAAMLLALPAAAAAQDRVQFGVQGNYGEETDFGVGVRMAVDFGDVHDGLGAAASFDYFFPDDDGDFAAIGADVTYWEVNGNLLYTLRGSLAPYVGAGLNLSHKNVEVEVGDVPVADRDATEAGLNVVGGLRLGRNVFAEARLELGGGEQLVVTAGFLF
jgi:hypothetical protein